MLGPFAIELLIIEEPEQNLGGSASSALVRILAKAARRGIYVLAATQSDHITRELNDLVDRGRDGP